MSVRKFIPKNAGMTKADIVAYVNDEIEMLEVDLTITAKEVTDVAAQKFVDDLETASDNSVDCREEESYDIRSDAVVDWITHNLKRKDIVLAITTERGY